MWRWTHRLKTKNRVKLKRLDPPVGAGTNTPNTTDTGSITGPHSSLLLYRLPKKFRTKSFITVVFKHIGRRVTRDNCLSLLVIIYVQMLHDYRPQPEDGEGNIFTGVSVHRGGGGTPVFGQFWSQILSGEGVPQSLVPGPLTGGGGLPQSGL